ncbi:MAG: DUF4142 domain-containing protein [Gemmatimonadota bacterium]
MLRGLTHRSLLVPAILLSFACARTEDAGETEVQDTAAAAQPAAAPGPSDAEIAHIVVTANSADSAAGELARSKAGNAQVRSFGERMVTDHTAVNEQAAQLAQRLNLTPADNATSQQMKSDSDQAMQRLQGLSGAEFDRAYIDHEVTFHQQVLDALDKTLIPNAQNPDLRALLEQTRPAIAAHLEQAKQIQESLTQ